MSYHTPPVTLKARKDHVCSWCAQKILAGSTYLRWASMYDNSCGTNKMHQECHAAACDGEYGQWEYTPGDNERPEVGEFGRTA